jgi:hypothetical protein
MNTSFLTDGFCCDLTQQTEVKQTNKKILPITVFSLGKAFLMTRTQLHPVGMKSPQLGCLVCSGAQGGGVRADEDSHSLNTGEKRQCPGSTRETLPSSSPGD